PALRDLSRSAEFCAAIRTAIGERADLLFGTHGQFTAAGAIRLAQVIAPYRPLWFEEPVPPDDIPAMARVARASAVPVATGERLTTRAEFAAVLRAEAAEILQPALGRSGGIWEGRKIAALAEAAGAQIAPHLYAGPVEWMANIHLATSLPNFLLLETIGTGGDFHRALIGGGPAWEDGYISVPDQAGLGIAFNEELARANPFDGRRLHLEMQESACEYSRENAFQGGAAEPDS
ncbi:MAG TPA: mandelate racemase/muconate lactonizing enzyme family protein, partial [Rhodobacteraceae bacterium]|nr:mandelate racemase/muconate lactonizing enzyme family protein [Paracoccaceae bacterium]